MCLFEIVCVCKVVVFFSYWVCKWGVIFNGVKWMSFKVNGEKSEYEGRNEKWSECKRKKMREIVNVKLRKWYVRWM